MIVFFGTSSHSAQFLELVTKHGLKFDLVVSAPPKPIGRKQILTENFAIQKAKELHIPFLENIEDLNKYQNLQLGIILDFNKIISPEIINLFSKGIINCHFSKLPKYRGASPVQYTILNGDSKGWISYYLIDEGIDTGKILKQTSLSLLGNENTNDLYQKMVEKASLEVGNVVEQYLKGILIPKEQEGEIVLAKKLKTNKCKIDWTKKPEEIERLIRACNPEPGAWTTIEVRIKNLESRIMRLKILKAHLEKDEVIIDEVQLEGKKVVSFKQFKQGYPEVKMK